MFCLECGVDKSMQCFSEDVHVFQAGYLQCVTCTEGGAPKPWVSGYRPCVSCKTLKHNNLFSHKQLKNGKGSTCVHCNGTATCSLCGQQREIERFSKSQLGKGFRFRRCKDCSTPPPVRKTNTHKKKKKQAW